MTQYILSTNRDINEHKQICNAIYIEAVNTPLDCSKLISFEDIKKADKTALQLRGIHRICKLYAARLSELQGEVVSAQTAKDSLKYLAGYTRLANYDEALQEAIKLRRIKELETGKSMKYKEFKRVLDELQKYYEVPKSFKDATKEEISNILKFINEEFVENRKWAEMVLLPAEHRDLMERYS